MNDDDYTARQRFSIPDQQPECLHANNADDLDEWDDEAMAYLLSNVPREDPLFGWLSEDE